MSETSERRSFDELKIDFCDEATTTWIGAARAIGRLAATDDAARTFIRRELTGSGDTAGGDYQTTGLWNDDGGTRGNIHRFRHGCCALASYASETAVEPGPLADLLDSRVRRPLMALCVAFLREADGTVGQLRQLPGLTESFDRWREGQIADKQRTVAKFEGTDNVRALEANRRALAALEALDDGSAIPDGFRVDAPAADDALAWTLACYLAGVRTIEGLLGFDLVLLVKALQRAGDGSPNGLPYVLSLPRLLATLADAAPEADGRRAAEHLFEHVSPAWVQAAEPYNEYVVSLASLPGAPPFRSLWDGALTLPADLSAELDRLTAMAADPAQQAQVRRAAAGAMRTIADRYFHDDWQWREQSSAEQFALNVYLLLMVYGPGALAVGATGGRALDLGGLQPRLDHRLELLLGATQRAVRARGTVLPALVRCLKHLLRCDLDAWWAAHAGQAGTKKAGRSLEDLTALCQRQLLLVKPLLTDWLLPATLRKDLATIVSRLLHKILQHQRACGQDVSMGAAHPEGIVGLIYLVLYAFPDNLLLREMVEFSTDDDLCRLFDCARQLIEQFEGYDVTASDAGGQSPDAEAFEAIATGWRKRYADFTNLLKALGGRPAGEGLAGRLGEMVMHLSRQPSETGLDRAIAERALLPLLLCGQLSRQDYRTLLDEARGHRDDRTGAMDERREREGRDYLAARSMANRFRILLDDIEVLEAGCLPEVGQPDPDDELVHRWRRLINRMGDLSELCAEHLPGLERKLCALWIDHRIEHVLEPRLARLVRIVEQESEADAVAAVDAHIRSLREHGPDAATTETDVGLIQGWMLGRYMLRELASSYGLWLLRLLTDWRFVAAWIVLPFVACAGLHLVGADAWRGIPFAVICLANMGLLAVFVVQARRRMPSLGRLRVSPWHFLLPQTMAAMFLAVFSSIPSDERWTLTIRGNLPAQVVQWVLFLVVGFVFTREIILGEQFRTAQSPGRKNRRATELMSLAMWEAFVLVLFFSMTVGRIMASADRGVIDPEQMTGLSKAVGSVIPTEVHLGAGFLQPASSRLEAGFWIHPRAIVSWTIQMFFFGAIFERIMGRSE